MILKIANGNVVFNNGIKNKHIYIENDKIIAITNKEINYDKKIDATNAYVFPGIIDAHVHLELQQGNFHTATNLEEGTKLAVSSGVTSVIDYLPFEKDEIPQAPMYVNYSFHKVISQLPDEKYIKDYIKNGIKSFKIFTTYSKKGLMLNDGEILALMKMVQKYNGIVEAHCENDGIILHNEKVYKPVVENLSQIHSPLSELEAIRRLIYFAQETKVHLHIVHTTLYESAKYINEIKNKKVNITFETCPQYLFLDDSFLKRSDGALYVCTPPLRSIKNAKKLFKYFLKNKIDILTTDHCSFLKEEKLKGKDLLDMPSGIPSLPYSLLLMLNVYDPKHFNKIVQKMSLGPAQIFGIEKRGAIKKNYFADLVIVKEKELANIPQNPYDPSGYNPYYFVKSRYTISHTIVNGQVVYENNNINENIKAGRFIKRR